MAEEGKDTGSNTAGKAPEGATGKGQENNSANSQGQNTATSADGLAAIKQQLAESQAQSSKLQEKLDLIERQQVEKSGDLKKVLELEKQSKAKLQQELDDIRGQVVEAKIRSKIQEKAKDAHNVDHLLKLGNTDQLTVHNGEVYGVDEFVGNLRKTAPHLFKIQDVNAGPKVGPTAPPQKLSEDYYKELRGAKTHKQLAAVRKKYGTDTDADKIMIDGRLQ